MTDNDKLDLILKRLDEIELEIKRVSKHVGFVDSLAESGAVSAITSLNTVFSSMNPMRLLRPSTNNNPPIDDCLD